MQMHRREAAIGLISNILTDEFVITSTGMISREMYKIKDRKRNFYMQGSMGMALAIGLGFAYHRPDLKVIVISGDGACLMSLGTLALHKKLVQNGMSNLMHYILDNNCHATTGGQPTISDHVDFESVGPERYTKVIHVTKEKGDAPRIPLTCEQIKERFKNEITNRMQ